MSKNQKAACELRQVPRVTLYHGGFINSVPLSTVTLLQQPRLLLAWSLFSNMLFEASLEWYRRQSPVEGIDFKLRVFQGY